MNARFAFPSLVGLCAAVLPAMDPPAPPGGFPVRHFVDQLTVYSDGYRTLLDIRYPDVAAPATGWPCLVVVHGGSGNRNRSWVVTIADMMARAGYVTLAYDTGNNGATTVLNPPGRRTDVERVRDLAEIFYLAEQTLCATLDDRRLAVMGKSGGGKHALWAASFSGLPLPVAGYVTHMPVISAVHSDIQVIDAVEDRMPGGVMVQGDFAVNLYEMYGPADPVVQMLLAGDYAGVRQVHAANRMFNLLPWLQQSDVPMFVSYAYDDNKHFVNVNADALPTLKAGVPRRYYQATGGHGSTANGGVGALRRDYTRRWCDRFLKNIQNGVDQEPYAEIAVIPSAPSEYQSFQSEWKHRRKQTWPIQPAQRLYLRGGAQLAMTPPATSESGPTIQHRVAPGYDMLAFVQHGGGLATLSNIPHVTTSFDTPPVSQPQEILGRTIVELEVDSSASNFQLQAALLDVPPSGQPRFITSGVAALRGVYPGRHRLHIELGDVGYILPAGHSLRLSLENLNLKRQPGNPHLYMAPEFEDCDLAIQIDPAFAPRVDLPMNPARASLCPRFAHVSAATGIRYDLNIRAEASRAGAVYQVLVSGSGTWPGLVLPPRIPINFDPWTTVGIALANTPAFASFVGVLDAQGEATATFALPPALAALTVGQRLSFAVIGVEPGATFFTTGPAELIIEP